jgi:hypothetical protein
MPAAHRERSHLNIRQAGGARLRVVCVCLESSMAESRKTEVSGKELPVSAPHFRCIFQQPCPIDVIVHTRS